MVAELRIDGIVSHWDIDGIASAAILAHQYGIPIDNIKLSSTSKIFDYYKKLVKNKVNHIFITDLNPSAPVVKNITDKKIQKKYKTGITWIDHHEWQPELIKLLSSNSHIKLYVEPEATCTAKIIIEQVLVGEKIPDQHLLLAEMAEDDDTFSNKLDLTRKWRLLLRWGDWKLRYRTLESWIEGIIWPPWAEIEYEEAYKEYEKLMERTYTTMEMRKIDDAVVVFAYPHQKLHPGDLQSYIEERTGSIADVYVFIYDKGVSLRSKSVDVSKIAQMLGGGGHRRAAGASIREEEKNRENLKNRIINILKRLNPKK